MIKHISIAYRQLFSTHSFGFISVTSVLGIIGLAIGIASLIIISCLSDGFSDLVNSKLSSIDGHIRFTSYYNDNINISDASEIMNILDNNSDLRSNQFYTENHAMIKNGSNSEGVIVYGCSLSAVKNIFNLDEFLISGSFDNFDYRSAILGSTLADNLNLAIGDEFYLFNVNDIIKENKLNALPLRLNAIIDTDFSEYDRLLSFIPLNISQSFFLNEQSITGIISSSYSPMEIEKIYAQLLDDLVDYHISITTWKDRHRSIISWLNIYDIPIKLLILLIVLVSIFNLTATIWMISFERKSEFGILKTLGFKQNEIRNIILSQSLILTILGCTLGSIIAFILLLCQHRYHWIALSSDIYFMDYLPVSFDKFYFLFYPTIGLFFSLFITFISASRISSYKPASVLMYE